MDNFTPTGFRGIGMPIVSNKARIRASVDQVLYTQGLERSMGAGGDIPVLKSVFQLKSGVMERYGSLIAKQEDPDKEIDFGSGMNKGPSRDFMRSMVGSMDPHKKFYFTERGPRGGKIIDLLSEFNDKDQRPRITGRVVDKERGEPSVVDDSPSM